MAKPRAAQSRPSLDVADDLFYVATAGLLSRGARRLGRIDYPRRGRQTLAFTAMNSSGHFSQSRRVTSLTGHAFRQKCSARSSVRGSFRQPRMCPFRSKHVTSEAANRPWDKLFRNAGRTEACARRGRKARPLRAACVKLCRGLFQLSRNATASFCNLSLIFSASVLEMSTALPSGAVAAISLCPAK